MLRPGTDYQVGVAPWIAAGGSWTTILPNMAVPGTSLTSDAQGNIVVTTANTTLYRLILPTGYVKVQADSCTVDQCDVDGFDETNQILTKGLVDGNHANATNLVVTDCTLIPAHPGAAWNAVMGHEYTARRLIVQGVDAFGAYPASGHTSDPVTVLIEGCFDPDGLIFISPDANHTGDSPVSATHNDWFQIQGAPAGSDIEVRYSTISGMLSTTVGDSQDTAGSPNARGGWNKNAPLLQATSCVMLTPNVSSIHGVNVHHNWMDGGQVAVNGIGCSSADGGITLTSNLHGPNTRFPTSAYEIDAAVTSVTSTGNTFIADGSTVPLVRS